MEGIYILIRHETRMQTVLEVILFIHNIWHLQTN